MRKMIVAGAFALSLAALPAFAGSTTVEFASSSGRVLVAVFNDDGTVSFDGSPPVAYSVDADARTVCASVNGMDDCATFDAWSTEPGHTTAYSTKSGDTGTATVTGKTE